MRSAECGIDRAVPEPVDPLRGSTSALLFRIPHSTLRIRVGGGAGSGAARLARRSARGRAGGRDDRRGVSRARGLSPRRHGGRALLDGGQDPRAAGVRGRRGEDEPRAAARPGRGPGRDAVHAVRPRAEGPAPELRERRAARDRDPAVRAVRGAVAGAGSGEWNPRGNGGIRCYDGSGARERRPRHPDPRAMNPIVLASRSPRRRQLLEMLGIPFRVVAPDVDETRRGSELPEHYVTRLAQLKARTVAQREASHVVLAADTTVVLRGRIFEKPATPEEAVEMLHRLQGRKHQVMTAVAGAQDGRVEHALDVTDVTFRPLSDAQIAAYVATGEPLDKAGAYAIQGKGAALVEGIRGDFFSVMGLPLRLALELLERFGVPYRVTR